MKTSGGNGPASEAPKKATTIRERREIARAQGARKERGQIEKEKGQQRRAARRRDGWFLMKAGPPLT